MCLLDMKQLVEEFSRVKWRRALLAVDFFAPCISLSHVVLGGCEDNCSGKTFSRKDGTRTCRPCGYACELSTFCSTETACRRPRRQKAFRPCGSSYETWVLTVMQTLCCTRHTETVSPQCEFLSGSVDCTCARTSGHRICSWTVLACAPTNVSATFYRSGTFCYTLYSRTAFPCCASVSDVCNYFVLQVPCNRFCRGTV